MVECQLPKLDVAGSNPGLPLHIFNNLQASLGIVYLGQPCLYSTR